MTPTIRIIIGLALAAGLTACQTGAGDTLAATDSAVNAASIDGPRASLLPNPTNGGPAYVGVLGR